MEERSHYKQTFKSSRKKHYQENTMKNISLSYYKKKIRIVPRDETPIVERKVESKIVCNNEDVLVVLAISKLSIRKVRIFVQDSRKGFLKKAGKSIITARLDHSSWFS